MNLGTLKWKKARANFARVRDDAGRCGAACTRACLWDAHRMQQPRPRQAPMSMLPRPGHAPAKGHRQPPWAGSQGQGRPPWACCQGQGMHAAKAMGSLHGQAAKAKARSQGQGRPPWASCQGQGMLACMLPRPRPRQPQCASSQGQGTQARPWHACVGTLPCPWGRAARPQGACCLRGSGRTARPWHAPWVGCQGRGMPLGPLEGHGSTWGGCCCQAWIASSDTSYFSPPKERLGKYPLRHEETLTC